MSKSSFYIGLILAVVLHSPFIWELRSISDDSANSEIVSPVITIPPVPVRTKKTPDPEPNMVPQIDPVETADSTSLTEVVEPRETHNDSVGTSGTAEDTAEEALPPPLQIVWLGPTEFLSIAQNLGLRMLAVDKQSKILGEITLTPNPALVPFTTSLAGYSNRVRTLEPTFFDNQLDSTEHIHRLWILIPASHDAHFIQLQRDALRVDGVHAGDVRSMEAHFQRLNGKYELSITSLLQK